MDTHVRLNVPPAAETARLLTRNRRWGVYYRSLLGEDEGVLEFRQIDPEMIRADLVDPADTEAVIDLIERRLHDAGYDTARLADETEPIVASWDIAPRGEPRS